MIRIVITQDCNWFARAWNHLAWRKAARARSVFSLSKTSFSSTGSFLTTGSFCSLFSSSSSSRQAGDVKVTVTIHFGSVVEVTIRQPSAILIAMLYFASGADSFNFSGTSLPTLVNKVLVGLSAHNTTRSTASCPLRRSPVQSGPTLITPFKIRLLELRFFFLNGFFGDVLSSLASLVSPSFSFSS